MKISNTRVDEIINFLRGLDLGERYKKEFTQNKIKNILYINESLTHTSANREVNYENLEFQSNVNYSEAFHKKQSNSKQDICYCF